MFGILVLVGSTLEGQVIQPQIPPPLPKIVLLPAPIGVVDGALGSVWETELWIYNSHTQFVTFNPGPCRLTVPDHCYLVLAPGETRRLSAPDDPAGSFSTLAVHRDHEKLHFNLRSRDRTRAGESAGTEIPVVREFRRESIQLLNIPIDLRFRSNLRIFLHPFSGGSPFRIRGFAMDSSSAFFQRDVVLQTPILPAVYTGYPAASLMLTDVFAAAPAGVETIRVEVTNEGNDFFWAYVSVTNNETAQFTTISPQ